MSLFTLYNMYRNDIYSSDSSAFNFMPKMQYDIENFLWIAKCCHVLVA